MAVAPSVEKRRHYSGPTFLQGGFRPFFFAAALWGVVAIVPWLLVYAGFLDAPAHLDAMRWHAHEFVYGYGSAVVTGFALTAIPNWTGRLPIRGMPLLLLFLPWLFARLAALLAFDSPAWVPVGAMMESAFLLSFLFLTVREVIAGKNWRNLKVVFFFFLIVLAGVLSNAEKVFDYNLGINTAHAGIAALVLLIMLIGGRIVPSFTINWLRAQGSPVLPQVFNRFDGIVIIISAVALIAFLADSMAVYTGGLMLVAGGLNLVRLARWCGSRTVQAPIVLMLHVSYLWVPLGFLLVGYSIFGGMPQSSALHAFTVGAVASMTLAVMTRASLGHTGRALQANDWTCASYALIHFAALTRILAGFDLFSDMDLISLSGLFWVGSYLCFLRAYTGILWLPRIPLART